VGVGGERLQAEAVRIEGHAGDRRGRSAGFVEYQLQRIAVQQVDAVEGRVLRRGGDLRDDLVVLGDQTRARGLRYRVGDRRNDGSASTATSGVGADIDRVKRDGSGRSSGPGDHLTRAVVVRGESQTVSAGDRGCEV